MEILCKHNFDIQKTRWLSFHKTSHRRDFYFLEFLSIFLFYFRATSNEEKEKRNFGVCVLCLYHIHNVWMDGHKNLNKNILTPNRNVRSSVLWLIKINFCFLCFVKFLFHIITAICYGVCAHCTYMKNVEYRELYIQQKRDNFFFFICKISWTWHECWMGNVGMWLTLCCTLENIELKPITIPILKNYNFHENCYLNPRLMYWLCPSLVSDKKKHNYFLVPHC